MPCEMIQKVSLSIVCFLILFSLGNTSAASQERVIVSTHVGACVLSVEANDRWQSLRLRAHHPQGRDCAIDKDSAISVLSAAFAKTDAPRLEGSYSALSFGRLIDFPWLSQYLATAASRDKAWDAKRGKPVVMDINRYVAQVLSNKEVLAQIELACARGGYRIVRVSVEKVLVGGLHNVPQYQGAMEPGLFPYDAIVWLRLEKN